VENRMIFNKTNDINISKKEHFCKSSLSQARGLMFRRRRNLVMVFPKERKIKLHMFFVFYPIDVLILDEKKKIVEIKRDFRPFTFWSSEKKGRYVVELGFPGEYKVGQVVELLTAPK